MEDCNTGSSISGTLLSTAVRCWWESALRFGSNPANLICSDQLNLALGPVHVHLNESTYYEPWMPARRGRCEHLGHQPDSLSCATCSVTGYIACIRTVEFRCYFSAAFARFEWKIGQTRSQDPSAHTSVFASRALPYLIRLVLRGAPASHPANNMRSDEDCANACFRWKRTRVHPCDNCAVPQCWNFEFCGVVLLLWGREVGMAGDFRLRWHCCFAPEATSLLSKAQIAYLSPTPASLLI